MTFAIKAHVRDPRAKTFDFVEQKTKRPYKIGEAYYELTVPRGGR